MLQPTDMKARQLIAAERIERLRRDARPPAPRVAGPVRRRAGAFLVASGLRLAGQCVWFVAAEPATAGAACPSFLPDGATDHATVPG
jgi:hypothetical protein